MKTKQAILTKRLRALVKKPAPTKPTPPPIAETIELLENLNGPSTSTND